MNSNCIVTQVHVPDHDVQGNLKAADKLALVEFGLRHLRAFNPKAHIILCGHGHRPRNLETCDKVFWNDRSEPLNEHGYVVGMPAQFKYVHKGLAEAKRLGFDRVLKTRGDCVIGIPEITSHCDQILDSEGKRLLLTQQTGPDRMGDCFMYGDTELLYRTWHEDNPVHNPDGLQNTATNFLAALSIIGNLPQGLPWEQLVKELCSFRDVHKLGFTCLRWNWRELVGRLEGLLDPAFDFGRYHWGKANGWHYFAPDGTMTGTASWMWCQKEYYK